MRSSNRLPITNETPDVAIRAIVSDWVNEQVPEAWRAAAPGGKAAIRAVRTRSDYEAWYPTFADSGLAVATWPVEYLGLDLRPEQARVAEAVLAPFNLGRLNPLGLNSAAPALFAHGTEDQRTRFLPPMVRDEERWCQLLSEPGAGSDLASLATRAELDGDEWILNGQKVWTTWAHFSDFAVCLARSDGTRTKRQGLTYFIVDLHAAGVEVRPLRHMGGEIDFNEVFLDDVRVPDAWRIGATGDGWRAAGSSLAGERQMVAGSGSGGVDRIGGVGVAQLRDRARGLGRTADAGFRQRLMAVEAEERIRGWTNQRVRATVRSGGTAGPAASIGKVHQGSLNQAVQMVATDLLGADGMAWERGVGGDVGGDDGTAADPMPPEIKGMLRSRANTIEGGTTEVNKNILGERVLGLPREPDPWAETPWDEVPRS